MSAQNPVDELAGHFLKIFTVGMLALMVIAIVTSAGDGPTRKLIYWSLMGLFVTCGALLGRLGAHQLAGQVAASETSPEESTESSPIEGTSESAQPLSFHRSRRPPAQKESLAAIRPIPARRGENDSK